jgi:hypothetical protein
MIAHIYNCKIETLHEPKCDYNVNILNFHNIFRYHNEYVIPNEEIENVEYFEEIPYFFKIKNRNIYCVQCHPDIPPELTHIFCNNNNVNLFALNNNVSINENNNNFIKYILNKLFVFVPF